VGNQVAQTISETQEKDKQKSINQQHLSYFDVILFPLHRSFTIFNARLDVSSLVVSCTHAHHIPTDYPKAIVSR